MIASAVRHAGKLVCTKTSRASVVRNLATGAPSTQSVVPSSNASFPEVFDVLVVGGGVVGSSFACSLVSRSANNLVVGLIENAPAESVQAVRQKEDIDPRVFAISTLSKRVLAGIGAWDDICSIRAPSFQQMQVWDALADGYLRFNSADVHETELGYIVENRVLHSVLFEKLQNLASAKALHLLCPSGVTTAAFPADVAEGVSVGKGSLPAGELAQVTLSDGRMVRAKLVVAADGAASKVRQAANIGTWGWDYDQKGVVATVKTSFATSTAWQRFLPTGPVAILPLDNGLSSIVWSVPPEMAAALTAMPAQDFLRMLNLALTAPPHEFIQAKVNGRIFPNLEPRAPAPAQDNTEHLYDQQRDTFFLDMSSLVRRVGSALQGVAARATPKGEAFEAPPAITAVAGPRLAFPLRFQKANLYSKSRVALIGDAAHTVHPLAGQNLNLGIGDADALANNVAEAAARGADVGAASVLANYSQTQLAHNLAMMGAFDTIKRLFADSVYGIHFEPLIQARNIGMLALNGLPAVKAQLIKTAMGTR